MSSGKAPRAIRVSSLSPSTNSRTARTIAPYFSRVHHGETADGIGIGAPGRRLRVWLPDSPVAFRASSGHLFRRHQLDNHLQRPLADDVVQQLRELGGPVLAIHTDGHPHRQQLLGAPRDVSLESRGGVAWTGDCQSFRVSTSGLPLTLTQAGAFVQGQYATEFTISGAANGTALLLEGGDETPNCVAKHGGPCTERLRIVVTSIDEFGQMSGTVEHTWNGKYDLSIKSGELWHIMRQIW